eukprot:CAMPEP_0113919118 /NCGR_PEP_ID=MMETSP0780_2-20120614/33741_1 /TAXON_ID=652834 /ORGANISM="Palpitomonas bilix" /LENGTH=150 /DNA_ID=CAMNT_0000919025 /DNA_START=142 /DNA_END=590 /DNA_ORIENTATION=- /assembly_acc=CAM_ASM_000599
MKIGRVVQVMADGKSMAVAAMDGHVGVWRCSEGDVCIQLNEKGELNSVFWAAEELLDDYPTGVDFSDSATVLFTSASGQYRAYTYIGEMEGDPVWVMYHLSISRIPPSSPTLTMGPTPLFITSSSALVFDGSQCGGMVEVDVRRGWVKLG